MRMIALATVALALSACGSGDSGTSAENTALTTDNLMMDDNMMMDSNASMNGMDAAGGMDANASTNASTENMLMQVDANTNAPDTNLANGL
ncbi:MAG TPA: hypothetical protein VE891_05340 [Allosphingosinicella sp.]|nr:hypothetical protein [Allosphingosinicella sp.]